MASLKLLDVLEGAQLYRCFRCYIYTCFNAFPALMSEFLPLPLPSLINVFRVRFIFFISIEKWARWNQVVPRPPALAWHIAQSHF
jgi:hypothetical protein